MASECIDQAARAQAQKDCNRNPLSAVGHAGCVQARMRLCPPADVQPVIEHGKDGINLLGVYQLCRPPPTVLAPYPPSRPIPTEATAQAALERMKTQVGKLSREAMKYEYRATRARKIELTPGFWVGLGLVALGAGALYLKR